MLILMLIAALVLGRAKLFLADWIPFIILFLCYEDLRGFSRQSGFAVHYQDVIQLERTVAFGHVPTLVLLSAFDHAGHVSWYDIAATMFYFLHFAFPLGVGYLLWLQARPLFHRFARTLLGMSFATFIFYLLVPVAPRRPAARQGFLPHVTKIIDFTLPSFTDLPGVPYPATVYHFFTANPVAAMPSIHAAYPFLGFLFGFRLLAWRALPLLVYCACVWLSAVYLGEHYVVDVIGGVMLAAAAFAAEAAATRWWQHRSWR